VTSWVLIPVKAPGTGKQRLAAALTEAQRTRLVDAMLERVVAAARASPLVSTVCVVSPEGRALPPGVELLHDTGAGLNALSDALASLARRGARRVSVIAADLPLVTHEDVTALVEAAGDSGVALGTDHTGTGTNALSLPLPVGFGLHFGPGSLERHLAEARARALPVQVVRRPGLAFDVDEPADLAALLARGDPRYGFLAR